MRQEENDPLARLSEAAPMFMRARGFHLEEIEPGVYLGQSPDRATQVGLLVPERLGGGDNVDLTWALNGLALLRQRGVVSRAPIVRASAAGLSNEDRAKISENGGALLFPLQFYDIDFRGAQEDAAAKNIDDRLRREIARERIDRRAPQPFRRLPSVGATDAPIEGGDLLDHLLSEMSGRPQSARIRVISGPAGVGKSVLLSELLARLHDRFNDAKRANGLAARPLMFKPDELGSQDESTAAEVIRRMLDASLLAHVADTAVDWLNNSGLSVWAFDGLDEFYRRQSDFFETLGRKLSTPGSRSQILICTRDSLMSSAPALIEFLQAQHARDPESVALYELARWDRAAKRSFLEMRLEDSAAVDHVMARLDAEPALDGLTDLPFYADLFLASVDESGSADVSDEFGLLQAAVDALISRESRKLKIDWDVFVTRSEETELKRLAAHQAATGLGVDGANLFADALHDLGQANLEQLLGAAAHYYRFGAADGKGLAQISAEEWGAVLAPVYLGDDLDEEREERLVLALMQFAFFSRGEDEGGIAFTHDLIADYLAAKFALEWIAGDPGNPATLRFALGRREDAQGTVFFRYLASQINADPTLKGVLKPHLASDKLKGPALSTAAALLG